MKIKKYLILTTMFLFSLVCVAKAAETYTEEEQLAIDKLANVEVMIGTENGFEGKSNLTRAQAATIMVRLKGVSEADVEKERKTGNSVFKDVKKDHWALGYINLAYKNGLVKGVSATEFNPEAKVKISELVTMAARSLNAGNMIDGYTEAWPDNYMRFASDEKLLSNIKSGKDIDATRCETAIIVANTLEADMWKVAGVTTSSAGAKYNYEKDKDKNLLKTLFNIDRYVDETIDSVSKSKKTASFGKNAEGKTSKVPTTDVDTAKVDLSKVSADDNVEVWYNTQSKKIVFLRKVAKGKNDKGKEYNFGLVKKFTESKGEITFNINGSSKVYSISNVSDSKEIATINGKKSTKKELVTYLLKDTTNLSELCGVVKVTGSDIDYLTIGTYSSIGIVKSTSSTKINFYDDKTVVGTTASSKITVDDKDVVTNLDGETLDLDAVKEGFIVKYYYDSDNSIYHIMTYSKMKLGEVKSRSSSAITIGSKEYKVNFIGTYSKPSTGDDIKAYLNSNDEIIMYTVDEDLYDLDEDEESDGTESDIKYGVVTQVYTSGSGSSKKLYMSINKGSKKEVDLDETYDLFKKDFDDKAELRDEILDETIATYVQYKTKDDKYILYQFGDYEEKNIEDYILTWGNLTLDKSDKTIGSYDYTNPTVYECVITENSSSNYSCTKTKISLSSLSNKKYEVSLVFDEDDEVKEMTVFKYAEATPVTPVTPTVQDETEGILKGYTEDATNNLYKLEIISKSGVKNYNIFRDGVEKEELITGSYLKYKLYNGMISQIDTIKNPNEMELLRCKIASDSNNDLYIIKTDNDLERLTKITNCYYVKGTITGEEELTFSGLNYTTTKPTYIQGTDYSESVNECFLYKIDGKVAVIFYK